MSCAPLDLTGDIGLATGLQAMDCQVNAAVTVGYGRLFGAGGAFGATLTGLLTIYVAVLAYGLMTGRTKLTLPSLTPKVLALGLVLTFATAWPAYQVVIYGLLTGGPDQIASAFAGARGGATHAFAAKLDGLFTGLIEAAKAVGAQAQGQPPAADAQMALKLMWASAITLLLSTVGALVVTRIVLAVLLAIGPLFIVLALFKPTRGLFEGWLKAAVAFALTPMLIVLGGFGVLAVLSPLISAICDDPAGAVQDLQPVFALFLGAVIYAALLLTLTLTAIGLTRGWRLGGTASAGSSSSAAIATADLQAPGSTPASATASVSDQRLSSVVAAVTRDDAASVSRPAPAIILTSDLAPANANTPIRRGEGLGQTFRPHTSSKTLSGAIGS